MTKDEFACESILTDPTDVETSFEDELGLVPKFGSFESKNARYMKNLSSEKFDEPRMFTMK